MNAKFDKYTVIANICPALFVILPIFLMALGSYVEVGPIASVMQGAFGLGVLSLLAQTSQHYGRKKEKELYEMWGGKATTILLRHRSKILNQHTLIRYHQMLSELVPNIKLPSSDDESKDPIAADEIYETCTDWLRERTREERTMDKERFHLLHETLINYSYGRNLLGMKKFGILLALTSLLLFLLNAGSGSIITYIQIFACLFIIGMYVFIVRSSWVWESADSYARTLLECVVALKGDHKNST